MSTVQITHQTPHQTAKAVSLPGGAEGYFAPRHDVPLVDIAVSFRVGSATDPEPKRGLSRLAVRMLRRGAGTRGSDEIEEALDRLGAEISVDISAQGFTVHAQVIRRNLPAFGELLTDVLARPTFAEHELARLKRETVAELIEARDSDRSLATRFFRRALFGAHPYGRGSSGTTLTVAEVNRADVVAFHANAARQGNVVLGVAGDVEQDDVTRYIVPAIAALPAGGPEPDLVVEPTVPAGRRLIFIDKPARTQTQILIGGLGTKPHDPDHTALMVGNTIFGGTFTARLMKNVRSERGWSYGAYSRLSADRHRDAFSLWTFPAATDAAPCIALELNLLEQLLADGVHEDELRFTKSYLTESYAFEIDTAYKRLRQTLDERLLDLPSGYHQGYLGRIQAVTKEQVDAALRLRMSATDLTIVVVGTAADIRGPIEAAIPNLTSVDVIPYDQEP